MGDSLATSFNDGQLLWSLSKIRDSSAKQLFSRINKTAACLSLITASHGAYSDSKMSCYSCPAGSLRLRNMCLKRILLLLVLSFLVAPYAQAERLVVEVDRTTDQSTDQHERLILTRNRIRESHRFPSPFGNERVQFTLSVRSAPFNNTLTEDSHWPRTTHGFIRFTPLFNEDSSEMICVIPKKTFDFPARCYYEITIWSPSRQESQRYEGNFLAPQAFEPANFTGWTRLRNAPNHVDWKVDLF